MPGKSTKKQNEAGSDSDAFRHSEEMFRAATDSIREQSFVAVSNRVSQKLTTYGAFANAEKGSPKARATRTVST